MDRRFDLASRYIRGQGIEIGALHQPLRVPPNVDVKYVDRLSNIDLLDHYPEVKESLSVSPDIIDDAETLDKIEDEKFDFCICNHLLEHMADPINAVKNWLRILKPGGILYISVPDISNPLDAGRELTTIEHLIKDNKERNDLEDFKHFIECAKYWTKSKDSNEIEKIARVNRDRHYSIHYHTFNKNSIEHFFSYLFNLDGQSQKVESTENDINGVKEYIYIIEKKNYFNKILELLEFNGKQTSKHFRCDVIIPVYNAYSDFLKCLYSALKYQNGYRIIFIDDRSTDPRLNELFSKIKFFINDNIIVIQNPTNSGFVKTVNIGMRYSKNDVILLNSDTIVTKDWAEKLARCAYSSEDIATVTPLSNNATICSVPDFCHDNTIPEGFNVDSFAHFIEMISLKRYPEIPTAVGFCMFIKRNVIEEIGYFDDITFGKGYGEENDFCMRAIKAGYKNVLCDDTFIYHNGSASFSVSQTDLKDRNLKILAEKYPEYLPNVSKFCQSNPLKPIHDNIKFRLMTWDPKKKRLLFILHHLGGGTEIHVRDLVELMKSSYNCYILQVEKNQMLLKEFNKGNSPSYVFPMSHPTGFSILYDDEYKNLFCKILNTFHIDLIHVHHLILHTLDIFDVADTQKIPIIMTFHDYYSVCPSINLLDDKFKYCHKKNNLRKCNICLSKRFGLPENFIKKWHEGFQKALDRCNLLIAPNSSVFEILKEYYNFPKEKAVIIEHGHKSEMFMTTDNFSDKNIQNNIFHIAYIGSLKKLKGDEIFYSLARSNKLKNKTKWSIFGDSDLPYTHGYDSKYNINLFGKYKDLNKLKYFLKTEKVNLIVLPSICPETFSYTLSEAWAFGIPVLVSNMGALKERVERTGGGWTVDVFDINKVEEKILEILDSPDDYLLKKEAIKKIYLKRLEEMQKEYSEVYSKYILLSKPDYFDDFILSNSDIIDLIEIPHQLVPLRQPNIFIRFYRCIREHGISYTIRKGYSYLNASKNRKG